MADVRGAAGVPLAAAFINLSAPSPSTPLYLDLNNGNLYALIGNAVQQLVGVSAATGIAAAGSTQGGATELTAGMNIVSTVAASAGVKLYASQSIGPAQVVYNAGANALRLYPPSGGKINQLATNAPMLLVLNTAVTCYRATSTQWVASLSA